MYPCMDQYEFINNKYTKCYFAIILNAKHKKYNCYTELHHIIPRSLGGTNEKSNIIKLSAREHFVCHRLLTKMLKGPARRKMICAINQMITSKRKTKYNINSKIFEKLKNDWANCMKGNQNPMFGKKQIVTEKTRKQISISLKNSKRFQECHNATWRQNISNAQSRPVKLINIKTQTIVGVWRNCSDLAKFLECTHANVKYAVRNKTYIGKKLKKLNNQRHSVSFI